jgi:DNA-binding LacI/PurR family transcriptional regulator
MSVPGQLTKVAGGPEAELAASPQHPPAIEPSVSRRRHWSFIARQIGQDILIGHYEPGANLPSMKWLAGNYRTTYRTLSAALHALSGDGLIRPRGVGYSVPAVSSAKPGAAIVFLAGKAYFETGNLPWPTGHDYLGSIEVCASTASVRIMIAPCVYREHQLVPENPAATFPAPGDSGPAILGYVHLLNHPDPSRTILESLARAHKPVCILDESGSSWKPPAGSEPFFRIFPIACTQLHGKAMGRYLIAMGHRRIAYFSAYGAFAWSVARRQGIEQSYQSAGIDNGVAWYGLDSDLWWREARSTLPSVKQATAKERAAQASAPFEGDHAAKILTALQTLYSDTKSIERHLERMFDAALKDRTITAWVAENDDIAILAAGFLKHRGVHIPRRISLLSFDNSRRAAAARLSSYSFGIPTIAQSAVRHIMEFSGKRRRNTPLRIEYEGAIIERDSSAGRNIDDRSSR